MKKGIQLKHFMALALSVTPFMSHGGKVHALSSSPAPTASRSASAKAGPAANTSAEKPKDAQSGSQAPEAKPAEAKENGKPYDASPARFDITKGFSSIAEKAILAVVNVSTTQIIEGGR